MSVLDRKLVRDLGRLAPQLLAIALLAGIGVAVAVMSLSALKAIRTAQSHFYEATRFADVFASAERAPLSLVPRLRAIEGAVAVDARASGSGLLAVPGLERPAQVRLIALPSAPAEALNQLALRRGRLPAEDSTDEAVASEAFLTAAHVALGERLSATINGRRADLVIVGSALSPEYVYFPMSGSALPDEAHSAVMWAPRAMVQGLAGEVDAFSLVSLKIAAGVPAASVCAAVDRILAPYGGTPAIGRVDQTSHHLLLGVYKRLRLLSVILPPVFLAVAAALTHVIVARLVETEREQLGLLKAFGYGDLQAAVPYVKLAALIGLAGTIFGGAAGAWLAAAVTRMEAQFFRFPVFAPQFHWGAFGVTAAAALAAALAGSALAVRRVVLLPPAVAMQAAPPAAYRQGLLDKAGFVRLLDQASRMIVRRVQRFPGKAILTVLGLASSLGLLLGVLAVYDSLPLVLDQTYYLTQRWNEQLTFLHPRQVSAVEEARRLPGVVAAEPMRAGSAQLRGPLGRKLLPVLGLEPDALLARALDGRGEVIPFEGQGVIMSESLAQQLGVAPGGLVEIEFLEGRRPRVDLPVTACAQDYSGLFVYMDRRALNRILGEGDLASGANLIAATDSLGPLYAALEARPQVIGAASRDETVTSWRTYTAQSFRVSILFYLGFGAAIAFGVAYNVGRITLAERARDLATLQVLGFSAAECGYVLFGELALLALLAAPVGIGMGVALDHLVAHLFSRDELRIPVVLSTHTLGMSLVTYTAAIVCAAMLLVRRLLALDLVTVLKTRD